MAGEYEEIFAGREKEKARKEAWEKYKKLTQYFQTKDKIAVAFSGGVDSTLLLKAAHDVLGDKVLAITADSRVFPGRERAEANAFCQKEGCRQTEVYFKELSVEGFAENPPNRCYLCKKALFSFMKDIAAQHDIKTVAEGSNIDDLGDYRPGLLAIRELGIESPLKEVGLRKEEIRFLSKELGLPVWNKPSFACLASRFSYGETITEEKLSMVEKGEDFLHTLGFVQFRVRIHGMMARIEVLPEDMIKIMEPEICRRVSQYFRSLGFSYTALDLQGYRTGSMNEILSASDEKAGK